MDTQTDVCINRYTYRQTNEQTNTFKDRQMAKTGKHTNTSIIVHKREYLCIHSPKRAYTYIV